jgi:hypothetical protein
LSIVSAFVLGKTATIDNINARKDVDGKLMDVHDGQVIQWNDQDSLYYWYGMGYQDCKIENGLIPPR